uniref:Uncharacterized protein n=1 Tax=Setaria viridis TaxID=4556 RepID=A0A4U6T445_SETVI|nr:hypothetical protein SEVIR_9G426400v2 [Setaria viridis]TKV96408.1 hypothetical protein SEVIR_9G426400v2 [Setaria viridis]TKV96409.1 hypothetical protein SEVIR_9G426400v2 [Setaria viridis]
MRQRTRAMQRASPRARPHLGPAHTRTLPRRAPPLHRALLALPARARHRMPASTPLAAPHADEHSTALSRACLVVPLPRRPHACASRRTTPPCAPPATARRPPLLWPIKGPPLHHRAPAISPYLPLPSPATRPPPPGHRLCCR